MKVKVNYFFFILTIVAPLTGALLALPYGLFIASTPYYFSWPFGGFWQEFFVITIVMMLLFTLLIAYMAMPWLVVIKGDRFIFHRLFRRKLVVEIDKIRRIEFMTKRLPVEEHRWYIGNIMFYEKDGGRIFVGDVPHSAYMVMREILNNKGVEVIESQRKITKEENEEINKRIIKW